MPASALRAFRLLRAFGALEFALKRVPGFTGAYSNGSASVNWQAVDAALEAMQPELLTLAVSDSTKQKILGGNRDRPMVQVVTVQGGHNITAFRAKALSASDPRALMQAARRVRNNLFHGGKEDPLEEAFSGDDNQWISAATDVASGVLDLVVNGTLRPLP
ncbi:TPA: hypothetical protein UOC34_001038 [Stenotrophomonas maltophilia]|uniref:hypothetical protein n=1 Tax=Stenotrophomonas maltophilia TaxID=40324 RepID=UPI00124B5969|nr:hypothetical protein [Stenotrophomonas maltophilia]HDS1649300.1 hypothetical protein [Stenotrophomonas maltophilia]HEL4829671.1 hypothetical protein [Stenotrophomonas maltophilia]HEL5082864.1 hypothetical protein [Stenotrophomonas maltophilia]HEL5364087.1 hypothetical protein [Stenotrophomonas maltophilia]